jgi:hypothetical protein
MTATHPAGRAGRAAERAGRSDTLKKLTRFGFVTYGVMHALLAWLAFQIAFGHPSAEGDQAGAFQFLAREAFGKVLLVLIAIGLIALTLWQIVAAAIGHTDEEGKRRIAERALSGVRAVIYGVLAYQAVKTIAGAGSSSADKQQNATGGLLSSTAGQWLLALIGLVVIGVGIGMAYYGLTAKFERKLSGMSQQERKTARLLGRIGYTAKGVAFGIVGVLLVAAAVTRDASKSRGLDQALRTLADQPFGPWLLGLVALGFLAFGVFCVFQARYRKV